MNSQTSTNQTKAGQKKMAERWLSGQRTSERKLKYTQLRFAISSQAVSRLSTHHASNICGRTMSKNNLRGIACRVHMGYLLSYLGNHLFISDSVVYNQPVLPISTDGRRKASATSRREVGYFFSYIQVIKERFFEIKQ